MLKRTVSEEDLARLKRERDEADRRYNEALTALDAAIQQAPSFPHPPPPPDEAQVTPLNERWDILKTAPPLPSGWRGRIAAIVWPLVEPVLRQQEAFNSALVDHVNRNIQPQRETTRAIDTTIALMREQIERLMFFQSALIVYLQQMTPYVDTKDYENAGLARRITEDTQEQLERLEGIARGLAAGVSGVSDEMLKRWESMLARDQRYDGRIAELRASVASAQQQVLALKREFERKADGGALALPESEGGALAPPKSESDVDSWKYVGFEDLFRGSREQIRTRLQAYVPIFTDASDVLDVGCGRGEFLDLLKSAGVTARGLDLNHEMVEVCRSRGLEAHEGDVVSYLGGLGDASLGGLFAAQVVEHLEPSYLLRFLDQAQRTLRPGAPLVLETINVACWLAFFESYVRDITHARPLHPDTLKYLVTASGFMDVDVRFKEPVPPPDRLQAAPRVMRTTGGDQQDAWVALADTFDGNVERLNRLLFTHLDYAIVARRA